MYDVLSSRKKKLKRFPSLKFRRSKSEICRPPLLEIGSRGNSTCDVIYLTRDWWSLDFRGISVGFWLKYLRNVCRFRSSIWGKCLKAVVKVAPSLQRLASARQVKISNHTMIVPSQLPPKKKLPMYRGRRAWGHASRLICWRDRSIRLLFYLVSSSRFFLLLSMGLFIKLWSIFVKRANFK